MMTSFIRLSLVFISLSLTVSFAEAKIYKIVDDNGKITYTDVPPAFQQTGEQITLPKANTQSPTPLPPPQVEKPAPMTTAYQFVEIRQPLNNATIPPGQMDMVIQVSMKPALQEQHLLRILYDGKPAAKPAATTSIVLEQLYRGTHQIKAQIIDRNKKVVAESNAITVHIKRTTILLRP